MAVSKGDLIAVDLDDGDEVGLAFHPLLDSLSWSFVPLLTGDRAPDSVDSDDFEALFNATIEPDADHDAYGDETQDMCPQLSSEHARLQGQAAGLGVRRPARHRGGWGGQAGRHPRDGGRPGTCSWPAPGSS